jgi:hypothetical protein
MAPGERAAAEDMILENRHSITESWLSIIDFSLNVRLKKQGSIDPYQFFNHNFAHAEKL